MTDFELIAGAITDMSIFPSGTIVMASDEFVPDVSASMITDATNSYVNSATDGYYMGYLTLPYKLTHGTVTKYLQITSAILTWYQGVNNANCYLDSFDITALSGTDPTDTLTVITDATNYYASTAAGYKSKTFTGFSNNTLTDTYNTFRVTITVAKNTLAADWRLSWLLISYRYA